MSDKFAWATANAIPSRKPEVGEQWAYRIKRMLGEPAERVEVLQFGPASSKNKIRIRFLDGDYAGLDEWVPKTRLLLPWEEHDAWWRDEQNQKAAWDYDDEIDRTEERAVCQVFSAYDEGRVFSTGYNRKEYGLLEIEDEEAARSILDDCGLPIRSLPMIYRARDGRYRASYSAARIVAKHLCQRVPYIIVTGLTKQQRRHEYYAVHGWHYGRKPEEYWDAESMTRTLEDHMPEFDLVRSWCSSQVVSEFDRVRELEVELLRLRKIIEDCATSLEKMGNKRGAKNLRQELDPPFETVP